MDTTDTTVTMDTKNYLLQRGLFCKGHEVLAKLPPSQVLKGCSPWKGPLRVVQVLGDYTYRLSDGQVWHRRELKRFFRTVHEYSIPPAAVQGPVQVPQCYPV